MKATQIGRRGEEVVCDCLRKRGATILDRNYRIRGGEIDIIAQDGDYLLFVEVKTRRENPLADGFDAIDEHKQALLVKTAVTYRAEHPTDLQPRFDVAIVTMRGNIPLSVQYVTNAFDATGSEYLF